MRESIGVHDFQGICDYFESQVVNMPDNSAVIFEGHKLSYRELNNKANQLAHYLISLNLGSKPLIAILMNRSPEMVISLLAALKIGGSYLPIDPDLPESRITYMLRNSEAKILLSHSLINYDLNTIFIQYVIVDNISKQLQEYPITNPNRISLPEDQVYVIYTSGSTGMPKGCMLNSAAVCNRLLWMQEAFGLTEKDRVLQKTPFSFDVSVWEFFWPLMTGATIVLAKPLGHKDPAYLVNLIKQEGVTVCHFVPSMLNIFLQEANMNECRSLRYVMSSGEALNSSTVREFYKKLDSQLINLYGPTEAAIDVTCWVCERSNQSNVVPIGKAIKNVTIHILDKDLNEVPYGDAGEICISGGCLADGYINQEELTNKSFIIKKVGENTSFRLYKTGDLGRFLKDGNIEYLGRIDDQIKLRGNRIELEEIESLLRTHLQVKDAVVCAVNNDANDGYIAAFVILKNKYLDYKKELKDFIKARLPEYMVPSKIIELKEFPLTENGKTSKKSLINICLNENKNGADGKKNCLSDEDNLTNAMMDLIRNLLNLNEIGIDADLYELGATSFTMMRLTQMVSKEFGIKLLPELFLQSTTVSSIVKYIIENDSAPQFSINLQGSGTSSKQSDTSLAHDNAGVLDYNNLKNSFHDDLIKIAASLLKVEYIAMQDDLFERGATSLTIMRISQEIHKQYKIQIPPDVLLDTPSLEGISSYLLANLPILKESFIQNKEYNNEKIKNNSVNLFSKTEIDDFKRKGFNIRHFSDDEGILLEDEFDNDQSNLHFRATKRDFTSDIISLEDFSKFIGQLKCQTILDEEKFQYPSAGSTYAVQIYIYLKENAVENLKEGIYYYDPKGHKLYLITSKPYISQEIHFYYNRPIYQNSSFSLFFIAQMAAIEPIYGEHSKQFATIEVGSILQLLMSRQAESNIGLCPVGTLNFDAIKSHFKLDDTHQFLQCVVGGGYSYEKYAPCIRESQGIPETIPKNNDIAIIGMSARYPGAKNLDEYWHNLKLGTSQIKVVPSERWNYKDYYDSDKGIYGKWGGFIDGIDKFDPLLFNIAPSEAHSIDPQQRMLLMQVWETLEDAGYTPELLNQIHEKIGVYVGVMWDDYKDVAHSYSNGQAAFSSLRHAIANRISHVFNFQGPSLVVDTSCSSTLTAIHLACTGIKNGDCKAAVVGGVSLILHPNHLHFLSEINMISQDDKSCAFGEKGTGWVPGEGVGSILIKPLFKAIEDGDNIYGVIKSSSISHSGRTRQFGMSNPQVQAQLMQNTLEKEEIDPTTIDYIECAASGALLFDAAECSALLQAYVIPGNSNHHYRIGSVKPNIGHLESVAALSQLSKVLLQMKYKQFVPTIDTDPQSPLINFENTSFSIQKELEEWKEPQSQLFRRAAINAFGGAGSYGHLILEAYEHKIVPEKDNESVLIILSAATEKQLYNYIDRFANFIKSLNNVSLNNIAYTLQIGRVEMNYRVAFVVRSLSELKEKLRTFTEGNNGPNLFVGNVQNKENFKEINNQDDLGSIAENWVKGAAFDWNKLYEGKSPIRISLPTYPFAEESYWLRAQTKQEEPIDILDVQRVSDRSSLRSNAINYLKEIFADVFEISYDRINDEIALEAYGISSLLINQLHDRLHKTMPELSKTVFFQCRTISEIADFLLSNHFNDLQILFEGVGENFGEDKDKVSEVSNEFNIVNKQNELKDIAIIGLSGRYPMSENLEEFWLNLQQGKHCISTIPKERWLYQDFSMNEELTQGEKYCKWGGFLKNVDQFDPLFFNISPREAEKMDPQERLFLETSWEVLEDAGYSPSLLAQLKKVGKSNKVGVFVGVMWSEYPYFAVEQQPNAPFPHVAYWSIANRVSYCLNLHGPSVAVDTACSSSLTALHMACESINSGSSTMAIAGGVNLSLRPNKYLGLCQMGFTSSEGMCRSFGEGGDGYVPSEGVGAVLLKPLKDAIEDGDHIYGIIKSSAINHGGRTNGYTVPDPSAHTKLIVEAIERSSINPREISYIEAHGTGTSLGDPIEVQGLSDAFKHFTDDKGFCAIGSVKSNIGHAEAAAGIAGLTKILLQFKYNKLVPTLHSEEVNREISFERTPFYLQRELTDWKAIGKTKYSGVSSFGAGGANAHVILAEASEKFIPAEIKPCYLIVLSAKKSAAYKQVIENMISWLKKGSNEHYNLESISYTLNTGREHFSYRGAWVVENKKELLDQLICSLEDLNNNKYPIRSVDEERSDDEVLYQKTMDILENELKSTPLQPQKYKDILVSISRLYIKGCIPDWNILHHKESHQRISLPTYPFSRESYWITDKLNDNNSSEQDKHRKQSFLQKSWVKTSSLESRDLNFKCIIIYDQKTQKLAENLFKYQKNSLCIDVSETFLYLNQDLSEYFGWVDLSANYLSNHKEQLLALMQQWVESRRSDKGIALQVTVGLESFYNHKISLFGAEKVGLYRMLSCEYPYITSLHLDLDPNVTDLDILSQTMINELRGLNSEIDVCYRNNVRYVSILKELELKETQTPSIRFDESEVLLVTGGTKGIGLLLARHFILNYGVKKVVLTGKELLPPREQWSDTLEYPDSIIKKIENIKQLERLGVEVKVLSLPLDSPEIINKEINLIINSLGPIAGVIHAAGYVDNENPAFIRKPIENIEAVFAPKIIGLKNLMETIDYSKLKCAILCSSLSALIPKLAAGLSDYASANAFMDYFASYHAENIPIFSIQWPSWRDTGMGEVTSQVYQDSGILSIKDEEGLSFVDQIMFRSLNGAVMPLVIDEFKFNLSKLKHTKSIDPVFSKTTLVDLRNTNLIESRVQILLQKIVEEELKLKKGGLDCKTPLANYGVDSILLTQVVRKINKALGLELNLSHLLEHTTIQKIAKWLFENEFDKLNQYFQPNEDLSSSVDVKDKVIDNVSCQSSNSGEISVKKRITDHSIASNEPIAVIGMSCQFPGANSLDAYWELLVSGKSAISSVPENCWGVKTGYFAGLIDRIYEFDPDFFMIAKEDAFAMDPQATLLLKESLKAIYDSNYTLDEVNASSTGVYIGARSQHQVPHNILMQTRNPIMTYGQNYLAANISQFFNFYGPSLVVDTACSSALVAMNMAVEALQLGKIRQALVAGVNLLTTPFTHKLFEQRNLLQKDGVFHIFDERASGIVLGEGVGVVYLKPLSLAQKDGDKIYAIISGISVNNDGRTAGPATPNIEAQQEVMKSALAYSDCQVGDIKYLDINGSGSKVTDLLEIKSIEAIYRKDHSTPFYLGSMKPNIGHPLCAEGIASFIKVCLMVYHQMLVPFLSGQQPLKHFSLKEKNMVLPLSAQQLSLPYAAINCFADGGTNVHVILKQHQLKAANMRPLSNKLTPDNLIDTRVLCPKTL